MTFLTLANGPPTLPLIRDQLKSRMVKIKKPTAKGATTDGKVAEPLSVSWPALPQFASNATIETLYDGICMIHNVFTAKEAKTWVASLGRLPLQPSPAAKRGEATRTNDRFSIQDGDIARRLWEETCLSQLLPPLIGDKACGLNSNIRVYRYASSEFFDAHYDDSVTDAATGLRTKWTLLVYLTGEEDGVRGGQTVFYTGQKDEREIAVSLERGAALLHKHGADCLLHEARPVLEGVKWVLRSDVLFQK